jgi:hypothetical protein
MIILIKNKLPTVLVLLFFIIICAIYIYPVFSGLILLPLDLLVSNYSPWLLSSTILLKNPYMQDSILQMYPWKHLVFQSLSNFIIPLWNPYQLMGMPFMAGMKAMVFYPLNIFFIFGEINAWHLLLFMQLFLASTFTYTLCRDFKLSRISSIISGLSFTFSSLMIGVLEFGSEGQVLLWLPLLLYCAKRYLDRKSSKYLSILAISITFSVFAGQLQYTAYEIIALIIFIIFYGRFLHKGLTAYIHLGFGIIFGFGISAIQLFPSLELFSYSFRGTADSYNIFAGGLIKPYQIFRLFAPDLFGNPVTRDLSLGYIEDSGYFGLIPLFFSFYAVISERKNIIVRIFTLIFIVSALLSISGIGQILYFLHLPLITSSNGQRIFILTLFSGAILSGLGFQKFIDSKNTKKDLFAVTIFGFISLSVFITAIVTGMLIYHSNTVIHNLKFLVILLICFLTLILPYIIYRKKYNIIKYVFIILILALTYFDFFHLGYRFLTFSNKKFLYPTTPVIQYVQNKSRLSLARSYGLVEPEIASYFGLYTAETYNPLYLLRSGQLLNALSGKSYHDLPVNKYYLSLQNGNRLKSTLDFLGIVYVIGRKDINPSIEYFHTGNFQIDFEKIYSDGNNDVFINRTALPRFALYYNPVVINNDKQILDTILLEKFDFKKTVIIEKQLPVKLQQGTGKVNLISSTLNSQNFTAKTDKPALFYISDTYFPGWKVKVNNKQTEIYRANYNFRAILIPKGKSIIEFEYYPLSYKIGLIVTVISTSLLIILMFYARKSNH